MTTNMQRKIIISLIVLFILSSAYLFWTAKNFNNPDYQKKWWAVYFENPKSGDFNFVIENHSDKNSFHYIVLNGSDKIEERDIVMNKGEVKNIPVQNFTMQNNEPGGKITIQVISGYEKKEIYKNQ
jgi:hypothetical protein